MSAAESPREGDEELSARKGRETDAAGPSRHSKKSASSGRSGEGRRGGGGGKQRASDIGRALRSAYDDTVREPVPDEFLNLLGKLS